MDNSFEQIYSVIGAEIDRDGLQNIFALINPLEQKQIFGACSRLHLVDSIQKTKANYDSWALINADALQIYLLCTCLDALADQSAGVNKRIKNLIFGLPQPLKHALITSYAIVKEPIENIAHWDGMSGEDRLQRVFEYIYKLRRNTFTHQAEILPSAFSVKGLIGYTLFIPPGIWEDNSVYFCHQSVQHSEPTLLRLIIIGKIRKMLRLTIDDEFVSYYWQNLRSFL